jgi:hypothetical protein
VAAESAPPVHSQPKEPEEELREEELAFAYPKVSNPRESLQGKAYTILRPRLS